MYKSNELTEIQQLAEYSNDTARLTRVGSDGSTSW